MLRSDFVQTVTYTEPQTRYVGDEAPRRERPRYRPLPERIRKARAAERERRKREGKIVRCDVAWPPMPIRFVGYESHQRTPTN